MLPLSLSYDHRVIDGADGVRFLRWVVEALEQPFVLSLTDRPGTRHELGRNRRSLECRSS